MPSPNKRDARYLSLVIKPIRVCATYKPKFGQSANGPGLGLAEFQLLYQSDVFYSWLGLDNPLMYAAHKAAGGITSVYRQIGIGCERLFQKILQDELKLSATDVAWSYEIAATESQKARKLSLDGRIKFDDIKDAAARDRIRDWTLVAAESLGVSSAVATSLVGVVFEVRQGYKSKDSKRQNADISNAITAYTKGYLPCVLILSNQIDFDIVKRYRENKWAILTGIIGSEDIHTSTYDFIRLTIGYDLAGFFQRNSRSIKNELNIVLERLLEANP